MPGKQRPTPVLRKKQRTWKKQLFCVLRRARAAIWRSHLLVSQAVTVAVLQIRDPHDLCSAAMMDIS